VGHPPSPPWTGHDRHTGRHCFRASVFSSRCESWRQNRTDGVSPTVTGWSGRIQSPTAPVSPTCLPVIPEQGAILNFIARNRNPAALNKHPDPVRLCSKWCGRAVPLRAATRAVLVHEMTIEIVRTDRRGPKKNNGQPQSAVRMHGPLHGVPPLQGESRNPYAPRGSRRIGSSS